MEDVADASSTVGAENSVPPGETEGEAAGEPAEDAGAPPSTADGPAPMSRNQLKRQLRYERKLKDRPAKRAAEKERRRAKRQKLREEGKGELLQRAPIRSMADSNCRVTVAIDMSYEDKMNEDFLRKTIVQLNFAYGVNRRAKNPLQYHIAHLNGRTKEIFNSYPGYGEWDVFQHEESIVELWKPAEIVYLTADSPNTIGQLDVHKVYVIGGLLDRNQFPGLSLLRAKHFKTNHARLPIDEHVKLHTRKVLTINQVFEIILRFSETNSWEEAFFAVIPKRKGIEKRENLIVSAAQPGIVLPVEAPVQEIIDVEKSPEKASQQLAEEDVIVLDDD
ncbi:TRNA methyltransferase 10-like protein A [Aphelenchoides fujianensis]|nr:TRNA methyltransferase 10-like protein A [Aphelenchoides fujianensis]